MKKLKEDIKNKTFNKFYICFGDETYLRKYYENKLKETVVPEGLDLMNINVFEGKVDIDTIINTSTTLPFMSDKRLIIIKYSNLFETIRKNDAIKMISYIKSIPDTTCIVFIEDSIDKKNKLYKELDKVGGYTVEFKAPSEDEIAIWLQNILKKHNKELPRKTAFYMLKNISTDMEFLYKEVQKLISYTTDTIITREDINSVCVKSLEVKVFDMTDAMGNKKIETALEIYNDMIMAKEAPIKILLMITRQFRLLIQAKYLSEQFSSINEVAIHMNQKYIFVKKLLTQITNFSKEKLKEALEDCLNTEISIKTGQMSDKIAVELLIIKYSI